MGEHKLDQKGKEEKIGGKDEKEIPLAYSILVWWTAPQQVACSELSHDKLSQLGQVSGSKPEMVTHL